MTVTSFVVASDLLEGRLMHNAAERGPADAGRCDSLQLAVPHVQGSVPRGQGLGRWRKVRLFLMIAFDFLAMGHVTIFFYGLVPGALAAWSLLWRGPRCEYGVAAKPR